MTLTLRMDVAADMTPEGQDFELHGPAALVVRSDDGTERRIALDHRTVRIGRSAENDLVLSGADKGVSRKHAELRTDRGHYVIVDLQSQNGTWVDGERVQRALVPIGAEIAIGVYRLELQRVSSMPVAPSAMPQRASYPAAVPSPARTTGGGRVSPIAFVAAGLVIGAIGVFVGWRLFGTSASTTMPATNATQAPRVDDGRQAAEAVPSATAERTAPPAQESAPVADAPAPAAAEPVASPRASAPGSAPAPARADANVSASRRAARESFDAAVKLDLAGDWLGALRKFDQARQADPSLPGLARAVKQVSDKMRAAGNDALKRAASDEREGRVADALKEYDRATQWLPPDDPHRELARVRMEQLKAGVK